MRILIIEDDKSLAELLIYGLEEEGFSVDVCHDGQEGLLLALQSLHDIILLDRMLPDVPGEQILKQIRQKAVIRSVMRRTLDRSDPFLITFGDLSFSEKELKIIHKDRTYLLSKKEAELLSYFLRHPEHVLTRRQIIGNVWGPYAEIEDGNLDNYIYLLRKKLHSLDINLQIVTIHRQGYALKVKQEDSICSVTSAENSL